MGRKSKFRSAQCNHCFQHLDPIITCHNCQSITCKWCSPVFRICATAKPKRNKVAQMRMKELLCEKCHSSLTCLSCGGLNENAPDTSLGPNCIKSHCSGCGACHHYLLDDMQMSKMCSTCNECTRDLLTTFIIKDLVTEVMAYLDSDNHRKNHPKERLQFKCLKFYSESEDTNEASSLAHQISPTCRISERQEQSSKRRCSGLVGNFLAFLRKQAFRVSQMWMAQGNNVFGEVQFGQNVLHSVPSRISCMVVLGPNKVHQLCRDFFASVSELTD